ncbi:MAG: DUF4136 domain-containing protein [Candidatus Cyclobacteriaceae bacterium M3_2C_046]
MKNVLTISRLFFVIFGLSSCMSFGDLQVESDYSYQGKFNKYKTFTFQNELDPKYRSNAYNAVIEQAVASRLNLMGYKQADENPDICIAYKVFYNDFKFNGYSQPDLNQWVKSESQDETYNPVRYKLKKGTLLVLFRDSKSSQAVWQGYASSLFANEDFKNERYLNYAVRSIFDQYRIFANDMMLSRK